jgi:hypothetical protein
MQLQRAENVGQREASTLHPVWHCRVVREAILLMPRFPITRARPYTFKSGAFAGRTFHSEREYRNALARRKGYRSWYAQQRSGPVGGRGRSLLGRRRSEREAAERARRALSRMRREGLSLGKAAKREGTTPNTVLRYTGKGMERRGARLRAKPADRLARRMNILGPQGVTTVTVRGSRKASVVADHWNAIRHYRHTGDDSALRGFYGVTVAGIELETDLDVIDQLAAIGVLEFEEIYEVAA